MVNKTILSLDVGNRRVGIALAQTQVRLANTLTTIDRLTQDIWQQLATIINDNKVEIVVVGLPRGMSGQETDQTAVVRQFATELNQHFSNLEVHFQDEAVTSVMAEAELKLRGVSYNKADIDALSAVYILTDYLNENYQGAVK